MKTIWTLLFILAGLYLLICLVMYFFQEKFIFFPEVLEDDHLFRFAPTENWEEVWLENKEARLHGLLFKAPDPKGIIVYFHGNAGSLREWGSLSETFTRRGYELLIMDFRGYGKSRGKLSEKALLEDAQWFYDYAKGRFAEEAIIVYGRSLGSGIAVHLAGNNHPQRLLLETPYMSLYQLGKDRFGWLPIGLLHRYPMRADRYINDVKCPVFMIHGTADQVIPVENSRKLLPLIPNPYKEYIEVPGGGHNNLDAYSAYREFLGLALE